MRITVDLPDDLHQLARQQAHEQNRSMSDVVADLTRYNMQRAYAKVKTHPLPAFMIPEIARAVFREAFHHYLDKSKEAGLEVGPVLDATLLD